jgi:peptide subunit release factor RF-3
VLQWQGGTPQTKEKILKELEKQIELACSGVTKPIQNSQTATGVKDVYTQFWIEDLISRFREMRKDKARSLEDIKQELIQGTVDNHDKIYRLFLSMKGEQLAICQSLHSEEFRIGFDPVRDTPIEILHTILLGVVKYV